MSTEISVLMCVYINDQAVQLNEALNSVLNQTIKPKEVVVVLDGPINKEVCQLLREYVDKYNELKIVKINNNVGLAMALNEGLKYCTCNFVARMDADDISRTDRFEKQIKVLESGYDVVSSWSLIFKDNPDNVIAIKKRPVRDCDIKKLAKRRSPISHAGSMYRKSSVINVGSYNDVGLYEDYYLWVKMIQGDYKFYNVPEPLIYVRTSMDQIKRRGGYQYLINEIKSQKSFVDMGFLSFYEFIVNTIFRVFIRLIPDKLRSYLLIKIWGNS